MTESETTKSEQQYPYGDLMRAVGEAYREAILDSIFHDPIWGTIQKWNPPVPISKCERRKRRIKWRWLWLRSFRVVNMASHDWHKREDCDGW